MPRVPASSATEPTIDGQNVEVVHDRLRDAILRGELAAGQELSQVPLAAQMGVSRTPLREALRMLQREGLVEASPNRSYRVAGFSLGDLEELYVSSIPLEAIAIRLTLPGLRSGDIAQLEGEMAQMAHYAAAHDVDGWEVPHRAFHRRLTSGAGPRLGELLDQLSDHAGRYRRVYLGSAHRAWEAAAAEHRRIVDACKAGDADAAAGQLAHHLATTAFRVMELVDHDYEPVRLRLAVAVAERPLPDSAT
jgi:GntR family transcriptional regulator, rspAB operon transcriptional repressor